MSVIIINEGSYASPAALGGGRSAAHALLTFADAIDLGILFLRGHSREASQEIFRRAVQEAYLDIINSYDWASLEGSGRIHLHNVQSTGTITYDSTTRLLTIDGAEWPSWVENGSFLLDDIICEPEIYISSTVIKLDEFMNPGKNLAAGTSYKLFCRWYPLPDGFVNFTGPSGRNGWAYGQPISMTEMAAYQNNHWSTGTVIYYAIGERPNSPAEKAIYLWPFANADEPLDFTYQRRPRELQYSGQDAADSAGTIVVTEASNEVIGTTTSFDVGMAGSILRISRNSNLPTGRYGLNRFAEQCRIHSVTSATEMALTTNIITSRSAVKYLVTDPIEIETCAHNAFLRYLEMHLARMCGLDKQERYIALAEKALLNAMAASYPTRYDPAQSREFVSPLSGNVDWDAFGG